MAGKQNNFYRLWRRADKVARHTVRSRQARYVAPAAVVILGCLAVWAGVSGSTADMNRRAKAATAWCDDPAHSGPYQQSLADQALAQQCRSAADLAQNVWALLRTYPAVTSETLRQVEAASSAGIRVSFQSYDAATGLFAFDAQSGGVIDIPAYIRSLQGIGVFESVSYAGYDRDDSGRYTINLSCILAAPKEGTP